MRSWEAIAGNICLPKTKSYSSQLISRGKANCGDIDVLITRCDDDGKTHHGNIELRNIYTEPANHLLLGVLRRLLQELHLNNILTEDLVLPESFDTLEATYRGLCQLNVGTPRRRIGKCLLNTVKKKLEY